MTCSDVQRVLPEVLDGRPDGTFAAEFETHLKSCPDCSDLVSDLKLITSEAQQLEATEEPSPQVWLRIAAQLRSEGLISDPATREPESARTSAAPRPILVPTSPRRRWSAWWLAPVAAGLVAAGSYVISHKPAPEVAQQQTPAIPVTTPAPVATPVTETPKTTNSTPVTGPAPQRLARKSAPSSVPSSPSNDLSASAAEPAPSNAEDQQFLSAVSTRAPSMRATYENQLNAVNADIRETQAYVNRNPGDADARQHLMDDYQQKALLYQIALDRIQ
jgi:Putative zinc-finger